MKEKVQQKELLVNVLSMSELDKAEEQRNFVEESQMTLNPVREVTQNMLRSGAMISSKKNEQFAEFCRRITNLYVRNQRLTVLAFSGFESDLRGLLTLDLSNNCLSKIAGISSFPRLEVLQLQSNAIMKIEGLETNTRLRVLNLRNNCISVVEGIDRLLNLQELDLSGQEGNAGLTLTPGCFECSVGLQKLSLKGNFVQGETEMSVLGIVIRTARGT